MHNGRAKMTLFHRGDDSLIMDYINVYSYICIASKHWFDNARLLIIMILIIKSWVTAAAAADEIISRRKEEEEKDVVSSMYSRASVSLLCSYTIEDRYYNITIIKPKLFEDRAGLSA